MPRMKQQREDWDTAHIDLQLKSSLEQSIRQVSSNEVKKIPSKRKLGIHDDGHPLEHSESNDSPNDKCGQHDPRQEIVYSPPPSLFARSPDTPPQKRVRSNDWPLRNDTGSVKESHVGNGGDQPQPRLRPRRNNLVAAPSSSPTLQVRRSRFIEGSMNDRASQVPPDGYIGENDETLLSSYMEGKRNAWSKYKKEKEQHGFPHGRSSVMTDAESSENRHSGIFRFGKVIASAFNPLGVWENVSEIWKGPHDGSKASSRNSSMEVPSQKYRAEKAYEELKASGYKGTSKIVPDKQESSRGRSASPFKMAMKSTPQLSSRHKSHPSLSIVGKELPPTPLEKQGSGLSPMRASFQDIRKSRSYMAISSIRGRNSSESDNPSLRKEPSRKDLEKQQKLLKKVSNLEDKLHRAKLELKSMRWGSENEPPATPSRPEIKTFSYPESNHRMKKKFVPGTLPSLPSERILLGQAVGGNTQNHSAGIRSTTPTIKEDIRAPATEPQPRKTTARIVENTTISPVITEVGPSRKRKTPSPEPDDNAPNESDYDETSSAIDRMDKEICQTQSPPSTRQQPSRKAKQPRRYPTAPNIRPFFAEANSSVNWTVNTDETATDAVKPVVVSIPGPNPSLSPRRTRRSSLRRKSGRLTLHDPNTVPITVTPGKNGRDSIPPVPPLPSKLTDSYKKSTFEWPEDIF